MEVHRLVKGHYRQQRPNRRGHYPIQPLGLELGIWQGRYQDKDLPWLRWYDAQGQLLPSDKERADHERQAKEQAQRRAARERQAKVEALDRAEAAERRAQRLAERLRALGVDPEA